MPLPRWKEKKRGMKRKVVSEIMATLLLISMVTSVFNLSVFGATSGRVFSEKLSPTYYSTSTSYEPPATEWNKTFGGIGYDWAYSVVQTSDGGYLVAGLTSSFGAGQSDVWLVKTDSAGNMEWNKTYGGAGHDGALSVQKTSDGGYIVAGYSFSFGVGGSNDFWLVKTDANGNTQWSKTYGGTLYDKAWSVQQTTDSGYIVAGVTESFGGGVGDFWLLKTDSSGNKQWDRTFGGERYEEAKSVQQTSDGGFIIAGWKRIYSYTDFWLVKTDASGNLEWDRIYGGLYDDEAWSVQQTIDGGYIVAGHMDTWYSGVLSWLVKTDPVGNMQWNQTYTGDRAFSVQQTSDGGYIFAGRAGSDFLLVKTDSAGKTQWIKTYGGSGVDEARCVKQTSDRGYVVAGFTSSFGAGSDDFWVIKIARPPRTWTVDDDGPADFHTIQDAINAASSKDIIYVYSGTYFENVVVNKTVSLIGENRDTTFIDANKTGAVVYVTANDVIIKGFSIRNSGQWYFGIYLADGDNGTIQYNNVMNNWYGIGLSWSSSNMIFGNNVIANNEDAIFLGSSSYNNISGNNITNNGIGFWISWSSNNNVVSENNIIANERQGIMLDKSSNNIISVNNIISNKACGVYIRESSDNHIFGNYISNDGVGIYLNGSSNNMIFHNNFIDNGKHVLIDGSFYNTWDDDYPSGGNYWSGYTGLDDRSGTNQNQPGSDGIGDSPYVIDENNMDWYPLMSPRGEIPEDFMPPKTSHDYIDFWHLTDFTITLTATDNLSGIAEIYYKINEGPTKIVKVDGQPKIITEGANNTLEYWSVDWAGNEESHHILMGIKLDKTAPTGSIIINKDATFTNSTSVTLTLTSTDATSGVYQVRYSNDGVWDTEPWETPLSTKTWTLPSGDGTKTVYYQIKNNAGLISAYSDTIVLDTTAPTIGVPSRTPDEDILPEQEVKISVTVTDAISGVKNVTLSYTTDNGITWTNLPMNYNPSTSLYEATIPPQRVGTWVKYKIVTHDNAGNQATKDGADPYCTYQVIPEFPPTTILPTLIILTTLAVALTKRKFE